LLVGGPILSFGGVFVGAIGGVMIGSRIARRRADNDSANGGSVRE